MDLIAAEILSVWNVLFFCVMWSICLVKRSILGRVTKKYGVENEFSWSSHNFFVC